MLVEHRKGFFGGFFSAGWLVMADELLRKFKLGFLLLALLLLFLGVNFGGHEPSLAALLFKKVWLAVVIKHYSD